MVLTVSNQKLSRSVIRWFLLRFINHLPPSLFRSSSHIGWTPSCIMKECWVNYLKWCSHFIINKTHKTYLSTDLSSLWPNSCANFIWYLTFHQVWYKNWSLNTCTWLVKLKNSYYLMLIYTTNCVSNLFVC